MNARDRYDEISGDLVAENPDVQLGQMMGMPAIKRGGKMIGGFWPAANAMVFKLTNADVREQALTLAGTTLFDPSEQGRPMREWVQVPPAHADEWPRLAQAALNPDVKLRHLSRGKEGPATTKGGNP